MRPLRRTPLRWFLARRTPVPCASFAHNPASAARNHLSGVLTLFAVVVAVLLPASPAFAHGADAPDATNYRSQITSTPSIPGVSVITIEAGARLQLTNHSGQTVEVLGYSGEPYLEVRPDGVYENVHSPAAYLNITILHVDPPAHADPTVPPQWRKIADEPMYRWHDQRALWTSVLPPDNVAAAPDAQHRIREWTVPLRVGVTPLAVTGELDWVPAPSPLLWWTIALAGAGLVVLVRRWRWALIGTTITAGLLTVGYGVAREWDAGNHTLWPIVSQLFTIQLWPTVTGLCAIAAGVYSILRKGDFALALGAAAVGLFGGVVNAAVFHRSQAPVPMGVLTARVMVAAIIALGVGSAIACVLRLKAEAPPPAPSTTE